MKPTKYLLKKGERRMELKEYNREDEIVQNTLHTFMELSQQNPLVLLMYDN
jgi:hypothetical protein